MNTIRAWMNKRRAIFLAVIVAIELVLLGLLFSAEAKFTILAVMALIPFGIICVKFVLKSFENALLISILLIPLLPLSGYILLRVHLLYLQWLVYMLFYLMSFIALIKNGLFQKIEIDKKNIALRKNTVILKIILAICLIVNVIFAFNKQLSLMIILLSFLPFGVYIYIIKAYKKVDVKAFYNKVILYFSVGCVISSVFDMIYFIMLWAKGRKLYRIYGPLGSNFILIYDLIIFVIILNKWVKQKELKNIWTALTLSMAFIISMQISRGALLSFCSIMVALLLFNIKNWKRYLVILLIFGSFLAYNVNGRVDVQNDDSLQELQEVIVKNDKNADLQGNNTVSKLIIKILNTQSSNRQILWKSGIGMTQDYPLTGVGLGNFKYFFEEYSGSNKGYSDAHNIVLDMSSEIGLPFAIIVMGLIIFSGIYEFIKFFFEKDKNIKLNRLSIVIICGVLLLYGNLTGLALQTTSEVYSFTPTFALLFIWFYRDNILEM